MEIFPAKSGVFCKGYSGRHTYRRKEKVDIVLLVKARVNGVEENAEMSKRKYFGDDN
jgi:hypothetical protein